MRQILFLTTSLLFIGFSSAMLSRQTANKQPFYLEGFLGQTNDGNITFHTKYKVYLLKKKFVAIYNPTVFKKQNNKNRFLKLQLQDSYVVSVRIEKMKWDK